MSRWERRKEETRTKELRKADRQEEASVSSSGKIFNASKFATALPTSGHVEVEMGVSPSSKKVTARRGMSKPKKAGPAERLYSYQKPHVRPIQALAPSRSIWAV